LGVVAALLAGCAKPPEMQPDLMAGASIDTMSTGSINPIAMSLRTAYQPMPAIPSALFGKLAGRTVTVSESGPLGLQPGEIVLTFDDGPRAGTTDSILDTLDQFGVKATFLMLGSAAERYPSMVREVAARGHTIGTHTYDHVDLSTLSNHEAIAEIYAGQQAVAAALAPDSIAPSRFFRFPYLAQNGVIRTSAVESRFIVLDVDIDSKDYYAETPQQVLERTLARLDEHGSGVVLFHDIHLRTVAMLPEFLKALRERGYQVVTLRSSGGGVFDGPVITADASSTGSEI
tara:strand:+ start:2624 stop:3487 length:864 start_codon:yes stop_codon:yes gene_type:complete